MDTLIYHFYDIKKVTLKTLLDINKILQIVFKRKKNKYSFFDIRKYLRNINFKKNSYSILSGEEFFILTVFIRGVPRKRKL